MRSLWKTLSHPGRIRQEFNVDVQPPYQETSQSEAATVYFTFILFAKLNSSVIWNLLHVEKQIEKPKIEILLNSSNKWVQRKLLDFLSTSRIVLHMCNCALIALFSRSRLLLKVRHRTWNVQETYVPICQCSRLLILVINDHISLLFPFPVSVCFSFVLMLQSGAFHVQPRVDAHHL